MTAADTDDFDHQIRMAAFEHLRGLSQLHGSLEEKQLSFDFKGERIFLATRARGIFKPRQTRYLLSIKTVSPRSGRDAPYGDQAQVRQQIFEGAESFDYAFGRRGPNAPDNQLLLGASKNRIPIIYFLALAPGLYHAMFPVYIGDWDPDALKVRVALRPDRSGLAVPATAPERRYADHAQPQRLHQSLFRKTVIEAYRGRCAFSGLPEQRLLDAAHIIADRDERLGHPIVQNGLPLSKTHHAAFDAHLIGIDPDYRLHVSEQLLAQDDGPMLEGLKRLDGQSLRLPERRENYPDRDRLELRFEQFRRSAA